MRPIDIVVVIKPPPGSFACTAPVGARLWPSFSVSRPIDANGSRVPPSRATRSQRWSIVQLPRR